ncbi:MAG: polyribonucleotide nucleotidyltransferase [Limnochordaceae bacterium]|nr:polyribonucleotide nucleotidyltransferase [Limnochordaceae bacterium]
MEVFETQLGGRPLRFETGELAKQANGAVLVRYGDTVVLVTATMSKEPREGIDFFPLVVDYEERMYSIGKIPGGWGRREGRPGEAAVLHAREIDRPIRPLFPEGFRHDVQVVATVLSVDQNNDPDIAAMLGASVALTISDIPFQGPIAGVRVGKVDDQFVIMPDSEARARSVLNLVVAGTRDAVMMVEAGANEVSEADMLDAIMTGHQEVRRLVDLIDEMRTKVGRPKFEPQLAQPDPELVEQVRQFAREPLLSALTNADKQNRDAAIDMVAQQTLVHFQETMDEETFALRSKDIQTAFDKLLKEEVRRLITQEKRRPDGRQLDEIRPITCQVGILPRVHGSGLFTRGQTQVLTTCTLGVKSDEQMLDDLREEDRKRYIHHYNFPPYSVGEVRPLRAPGRREIGHGALAERALLPVIPPEEDFPYTIRLVSEVLESNGSTSQASVCGSTLALMDAGVPIRKPVAGVAMGLVKYGDSFAILTDIQGIEDALGDMDFKVAGTRDGITAIQMDIKIAGVTRDILAQALEQARRGRLFILDKMLSVIPAPRAELSPYAPRIITMEIPVDKIRDVIGPGGKMIRSIIDQTGVEIDVEDDGHIFIASADQAAGAKAKQIIENLVRDVEVGATYLGKVKRTTNFGAFVEILPGKEGLVHISELSRERVGRVEDVVNVGDELLVKVTDIDRLGRINLSHKECLPPAEGEDDHPRRAAASRPERGERRERSERSDRGEHNEYGERGDREYRGLHRR